jgi:hypothetical protein
MSVALSHFPRAKDHEFMALAMVEYLGGGVAN